MNNADPLVQRIKNPHKQITWLSVARFLIVPERAFVCAGLILGLLNAFLTPPFQVDDEPSHLYRSFAIAEGNLIPEVRDGRGGGEVPTSFLELNKWVWRTYPLNPQMKLPVAELVSKINLPLEPDQRQWSQFPHAFYPFVVYLPQALGVGIGKALGLTAFGLLYAGRLANLLTWLVAVYFAIRIVPFGKWIFFFVGLLPMAVRQAASLSADVLTNASAYLFIAMVLNVAFDGRERVRGREFACLCAVGVTMLLTKQVYFVLAVLYFLIPPRKFGSRISYVGHLTTYTVILGCAFVFAGMMLTQTFVDFHPQANRYEQLQGIIAHPLTYFEVFVTSVFRMAVSDPGMLETYIGYVSWLEPITLGPPWLLVSYLVGFVVVILLDTENRPRVGAWPRAVLLATFAFSLIVLLTAVYLYANPVGAGRISGIAGRNFAPIMPLLFFGLSTSVFRLGNWQFSLDAAKVGFSVAGLLTMLGISLQTHYIPQRNLIPNGNLADWPQGAVRPTAWHWDALPPDAKWSLKPAQDGNDNVGVQQTWAANDGSDSIFHKFGITLAGLRPYSRYKLYVRAKNLSRGMLRISAWECGKIPEEGGNNATTVPVKRLRLELINVKPFATGFTGYAGEFATLDGTTVRLVASCSGEMKDFPATVVWDDWVLVPISYGLPWRRFWADYGG